FHRAQAPFLGPKSHSDGRDEEQVEPGMPEKKRDQRSFAPLEKAAQHEREESAEQQKDYDKYVGDRRGKVAANFEFSYGFDIPECAIHFFSSCTCTVSGKVIDRKTSSSRPSSVCNSSIFQLSFMLVSATARANSPFRGAWVG